MSNELMQEQYDGSEMQNPVPFTDFLEGGNEVGIEPEKYGKQIMGIVGQVEEKETEGKLLNFVDLKERKQQQEVAHNLEIRQAFVDYLNHLTGGETNLENVFEHFEDLCLRCMEKYEQYEWVKNVWFGTIEDYESDLFAYIPKGAMKEFVMEEIEEVIKSSPEIQNTLKSPEQNGNVLIEKIFFALFDRETHNTIDDLARDYYEEYSQAEFKKIYG